MGVDICLGGLLTTMGIILGVITFGGNIFVSGVMGNIGIGIVSTLPLSNKIFDKRASKNRNLCVLALMLPEVKSVFSKALNDEHVAHEEFEIVIKSKENFVAFLSCSHIYHNHIHEFLYHRILFHELVHLVLLLPYFKVV